MNRPLRTHQSTGGFTLVELLVALVIMSFGAVVLGQLMFKGSRASRVRSNASYRTAALTQAVERLGAIPFDYVTVGSSCTTVSTGAFPYSLCTTVTSISTVSRQVTVIVTPTGADALPPDTARLIRNDPIRVEPLGAE